MSEVEFDPLKGIRIGDTIAVDMHNTGTYRRAKVRMASRDGFVMTDSGIRFDRTGFAINLPPTADECTALPLDRALRDPQGRWIAPDREWAKGRAACVAA